MSRTLFVTQCTFKVQLLPLKGLLEKERINASDAKFVSNDVSIKTWFDVRHVTLGVTSKRVTKEETAHYVTCSFACLRFWSKDSPALKTPRLLLKCSVLNCSLSFLFRWQLPGYRWRWIGFSPLWFSSLDALPSFPTCALLQAAYWTILISFWHRHNMLCNLGYFLFLNAK